jgi:hypothetical protein
MAVINTAVGRFAQLPRRFRSPVAARQEEAVIVTQTIVRPSTTFTAYVTLGGPPTLPPGPETTSTPEPTPTPTPRPSPDIYGAGSLASWQIGAILGAVVALVALVLVGWFCLSIQKKKRYYSDAGSGSETSSEHRHYHHHHHQQQHQHHQQQRPPRRSRPPGPPPNHFRVNITPWAPNINFNGPPRRI